MKNKRKKDPVYAGNSETNYKEKIICLLQTMEEEKEQRFLIQIYIMIRRHISREAH
ncbi:MAG: hypothetical protein UHU19_07055 [Lachnospiraceae bacterium]|nr:hypothetical protein [Lachnospiraceae bacterium]